MTRSFFITSTGTDIGKTLVTATLCWQLRERGSKVTALKPVISGFDTENPDNDSAVILRSCGFDPTPQMMKVISPWRFSAPLAPNMAAKKEKKFIVFDEVPAFCEEHLNMKSDVLLVEGVGGVMAPIDDRHTVLDWMEHLRWPVILVCGSYLGAISHTLTALAVLREHALDVAALIVSESESGDLLQETADTLSKLAPPEVPIVKLPRARPQAELWKSMPNISWICQEQPESEIYEA